MIGWTQKIIAFIATVAFAFVVKANVVLFVGGKAAESPQMTGEF